MKRLTYYILLAMLMAAAFASCEDDGLTADNGNGGAEGTPVVIDCSATVNGAGATTRAMGATATINSLYALVFNKDDILTEVVEATPGTYNEQKSTFAEATTDGKTAFYVILHASSEHRVVHLVANYVPSDYRQVEEYSVMRGFSTSGSDDAYWCRIDLPNGIKTDNTGVVDSDTKSAFNDVKLLRNFAEIKIKNDAGNLTVLGYYVFNQPASGTVAPWQGLPTDSKDPTENGFATFEGKKYSEMTYTGYEPEGVTIKANPEYAADGSTDSSFPFLGAGEATYVYEHTYDANGTNPFIIIKAQYNGSTTPTYYKADLCYKNDNDEVEYYNLLRNFTYTLTISSVSAEGYSTIWAAVNNPAMNNFLSSAESGDFTNVSAGSSQLFVNTTDELITKKREFVLKFKNVYDGSVSNSVKDVDVNVGDHYVSVSVVHDETDGTATDGHIFYGEPVYSTENDSDGYRSITLKLKDLPADGTLASENILITNNHGLQRTVRIEYRTPMKFDVIPTQSDYTGDNITQMTALPTAAEVSFNLLLRLPAGLSVNRFPLTFSIESSLVNFYPNVAATGFVAMTVISGWSLVPDNPYKSYHYNRIITWNEYNGKTVSTNGYKYFGCFFKTYCDINATDFHMSQYRNRYRIVVQTDRYFESPLFVLEDCARTYDKSLSASTTETGNNGTTWR